MSLDVRRGEGGLERAPFVDTDGELYEILAHPQRSTVCSILLEHTGTLSTTELVSRVLAQETTSTDDTTSTDARREVHLSLYHRHLPKLADCGVLTWDRESETVALAEEPSVDRDRLEAFLTPAAIHRSGELFELLAHPRRRAILAAFGDRSDVVSVEALAKRVVAIEEGQATDAVSSTAATRAHVELRHVHLPAMADVGLVEYDHANDRVRPRDHPALLGR